jgi:hypothetical protein
MVLLRSKGSRSTPTLRVVDDAHAGTSADKTSASGSNVFQRMRVSGRAQ